MRLFTLLWGKKRGRIENKEASILRLPYREKGEKTPERLTITKRAEGGGFINHVLGERRRRGGKENNNFLNPQEEKTTDDEDKFRA